MALRRNQLGQGGMSRQTSRHKGDRPGRQTAALGASDITTGSNMRVNKNGQLVVNRLKAISTISLNEGGDASADVQTVASSVNSLIEALRAAKLMDT